MFPKVRKDIHMVEVAVDVVQILQDRNTDNKINISLHMNHENKQVK